MRFKLGPLVLGCISALTLCTATVSQAGVSVVPDPTAFKATPSNVVAVNLGGSLFKGPDGTVYLQDSCAEQTHSTCGTIDKVKGSQQEALYQSFREGPQSYELQVAPGQYALTLFFAERPGVENRRFSVWVGGKERLADFNIPKARDGLTEAALARTLPVDTTDGSIVLEFRAAPDMPLISAFRLEPVQSQTLGTLRWADEFDGTALDSRFWSVDEWPARKVNDEDQAYVNSRENLRLEDGKLIIEAHQASGSDAKYHSGRIHSSGKLDFMYGRLDVRAKLPRGQGVWPAIWLLPTHPYRYATICDARTPDWQGNANCDAWPNSGEIDLMEHVGFEPGVVHGTVHTKGYYWVEGNQRKGSIVLPNLAEDFHVYTLQWTPDRMDMLVDGLRYFTYTRDGEGWRQWPFDHSFHVIMNLAIGGMWGRAGGPIDDSIFPQRMVVDYVRIYDMNQIAE